MSSGFGIAILLLLALIVLLRLRSLEARIQGTKERKFVVTRSFKIINQICFYTCLASIFASVLIMLVSLWDVIDDKTLFLKLTISVGIVFGASLLTAGINIFFASPNLHEEKESLPHTDVSGS